MTHRLRKRPISLSSLIALLIFTQKGNVRTCDAAAPVTAAFTPTGGTISTVIAGASYALYSFAVDKYATRLVKRMELVPTPEEIRSSTSTSTSNPALAKPSHLRTTVSKQTNVVANCDDRLLWNQWIASEVTDKMSASSNKSATDAGRNTSKGRKKITPADFRSLFGITHQFKYRTYVNFEEAGAISKPFYTWKRLGPMFQKPGELKFLSPDCGDGDGEDEGDEDEGEVKDRYKMKSEGENGSKDVLALVTNREDFKLGLFIPIIIQWWGKVVPVKDDVDDGALDTVEYCVEWTQTEAQIVLPGINKKIKKLNPKVSTELSSTPWDIEKIEDGMVCFRRGDIGHLVYDSK